MRQELEQAIADVCKELFKSDVSIELTRPDEQFGDYATNVALQLAKQLGKNPAEVAEVIKNSLQHSAVASVELAGPGFINIRLTDEAVISLMEAKNITPMAGTVVVCETNNPNPFKAMHIGHAFNAILAESVANLVELSGAKTHRVSYHGDVGLHVGKSMYSLLKFVDGDAERLETIAPNERNTFMSRMYSEGSQAYKEDSDAKMAIDELAKQSFTLDNPLYKKVYGICKTWSFEQIDELVARLGNKPVEKRYLESEADSLGVETVKKHIGKVFVESDGAIIFPGSKYGSFDNVFVSSVGRGLYGARDLGLMQLKHRDFSTNKSYIVTAEEQRDYFKGVIKAAELCLPELSGVTINISTGTVKLSTGKMSSRSGDVLEVAWLFEQITSAIENRGGSVDEAIVMGALRYQFLKVRIGSDVVFDIEEAVSIQGNSGPYLQYAHARACSILSKAKPINSKQLTAQGFEPGERSLARKIGEYSEVLDRAILDLMPHHICTYLYELAQVFNSFYEHNRVIGDERQNLRLGLVQDYATTLKNGLALLNIPAPERM